MKVEAPKSVSLKLLQQLSRYAYIYIDTQQRFHGVYADKILIGRGLELSGKLPCWDIEANITSQEKLRIFCHYLDRRAIEYLKKHYRLLLAKC
jgi:hypothetical protein